MKRTHRKFYSANTIDSNYTEAMLEQMAGAGMPKLGSNERRTLVAP